MYVSAILLAAGFGARFKSKIPKPLVKINSRPLISYSLKALNSHPQIKDIIVVANSANRRGVLNEIRRSRVDKFRGLAAGGERRQDSAANALKILGARTDIVLIHDAARPFIKQDTITAVIKEAEKSGAAVVGVPVKATIKEAHRAYVKKTLDRNNLWEIQTPQVFKKELILNAFEKFGRQDVTDDAMLVEKLGKKVRIVSGSYDNIKITTPEDLVIAEAILKRRGR